MKNIDEILHYDIIENVGIGSLQFGMNIYEFFDNYDVKTAMEEGKLEIVESSANASYIIDMFTNSIHLAFDKDEKLEFISLSGNHDKDECYTSVFKGKFMGKIALGSKFGELRALRRDMQYEMDTESIYLGTGYKFRFMLESENISTYGEEIRNFYKGEIDDWFIEKIYLQKWEKNRFDSETFWCYWRQSSEGLNIWIEPEEKYLDVRYG